jgi:hypothetical protein
MNCYACDLVQNCVEAKYEKCTVEESILKGIVVGSLDTTFCPRHKIMLNVLITVLQQMRRQKKKTDELFDALMKKCTPS